MMIRLNISILLITLTVISIAAQKTGSVLKVNAGIYENWRFGAPVYAVQAFPGWNPHVNKIIYRESMLLRGQIILNANDNEIEERFPVRTKKTDITHIVEVAGAQVWDQSGNRKWFTADELPPLKVYFEPEMPNTIFFPNENNCVLLFEIGGPGDDNFIEGSWNFYLRINTSELNWQLLAASTETTNDPAFPSGTSLLRKISFQVKSIKSKIDSQNVAFYNYRLTRNSGSIEIQREGLPILNKLIEANPQDGYLLYERAQLYAELNMFQEATKDALQIINCIKQGNLTRIFDDPLMIHDQDPVDFLTGISQLWDAQIEKDE